MTRTEAARLISRTITGTGDYATSVWAPEGESGPIRVYVTIPAPSRKKSAQQIGYIAVNRDGTVESELTKQSGTIMALLPTLEITPVAAQSAASRQPVTFVGEDVAAFQSSERKTYRDESNREIG